MLTRWHRLELKVILSHFIKQEYALKRPFKGNWYIFCWTIIHQVCVNFSKVLKCLLTVDWKISCYVFYFAYLNIFWCYRNIPVVTILAENFKFHYSIIDVCNENFKCLQLKIYAKFASMLFYNTVCDVLQMFLHSYLITLFHFISFTISKRTISVDKPILI